MADTTILFLNLQTRNVFWDCCCQMKRLLSNAKSLPNVNIMFSQRSNKLFLLLNNLILSPNALYSCYKIYNNITLHENIRYFMKLLMIKTSIKSKSKSLMTNRINVEKNWMLSLISNFRIIILL